MLNLEKSLKQEKKTWRHVVQNEGYRIYANFADIYSGFTDGKSSLGYGHTADYWAKSVDLKPAEAFAEMCSAYISNPNSWKFLKKNLPQATKCFEEMLKEIKI